VIRVEVEACGICHSDALARSGAYPGLTLPRIPGHEIAGRVDAVGANVTAWKVGDRVATRMADVLERILWRRP
jgi:D-arabinose 1-dehydrogenase-like Zn-dependent alcohol dehydrogenase